MKIEAKPATAEDYERIKWWFDVHGVEPVDARVLPPVGIIVSVDDVECACAWLYTSDGACGVGFLHHIGTNPRASEVHRAVALKRGMGAVEAAAHELGMKVIFGTINDMRFLKVAQKLGWEAGSQTNHVGISWE